MIFCRRMSWLLSWQIGMAELAANALFPTGGAGGLALGAWALRRGGMPAPEIARRSVSFFLLTSVPNVVGVIVIGARARDRRPPGEHNLLLTAASRRGRGRRGRRGPPGRPLRRKARRRRKRATAGQRRRKRVRALRASVAAIAGGVSEALALLREANPILLTGLLAYLVFDVMILWATFHAIGLAPLLGPLAMGYLIGELGGLIPVPGGIGGIDAGLVGTLVLYHVPLTAAAGAVLAYRAIVAVGPRDGRGSRVRVPAPNASPTRPTRSRSARRRPRWRSSASAAR